MGEFACCQRLQGGSMAGVVRCTGQVGEEVRNGLTPRSIVRGYGAERLDDRLVIGTGVSQVNLLILGDLSGESFIHLNSIGEALECERWIGLEDRTYYRSAVPTYVSAP